jgi:YceI-like domain
MNIKHSVNAPALSGKRSSLRRFVSVVTAASVLTLGVASAFADGGGKGTFSLSTIAGMGEKYTGKLDVKGGGKFAVSEAGGNLVFTLKASDLNMKDGRQKHTVGKDSKLGLNSDHSITLTIEKSKLSFPEAGKEVSGKVPGTLNMLGKPETVTVAYTVKEEGGHYVVQSANFDFDYTKHVAGGKQVCLLVVCVKPTVSVVIDKGAVIEAKK